MSLQQPSLPVIANFDARHLTVASGAAIFHVKSERVVLCYHTKDKYWFLPKGRRDANEESGRAAVREGFEEPFPHFHDRTELDAFTTEPVWTQLVPLSPRRQYLLFWYICETLPPEDEAAFLQSKVAEQADTKAQDPHAPRPPQFTHPIPPYPRTLTLEERMKLEDDGWEPTRVEGTGVDAEEAMYTSALLPVPQALEKLGRGLSASIVSKGLELIRLRKEMEKEMAKKE